MMYSIFRIGNALKISEWKNLSLKLTRLARYSLFCNAGYLMGVDVVNSLGGFLFWGIGTRVYPPESVGIAAAVLSSGTFIASLAGLGLGVGLIRFLPESKNPSRLLNTSLTFNFTLALFAA